MAGALRDRYGREAAAVTRARRAGKRARRQRRIRDDPRANEWTSEIRVGILAECARSTSSRNDARRGKLCGHAQCAHFSPSASRTSVTPSAPVARRARSNSAALATGPTRTRNMRGCAVRRRSARRRCAMPPACRRCHELLRVALFARTRRPARRASAAALRRCARASSVSRRGDARTSTSVVPSAACRAWPRRCTRGR